MRVLFLQRQPCIRALKYAVALRARRADLRLGFAYQGRTLGGWYGEGDELFERWWRLDATRLVADLRRAVAQFAPDLIHSHNLPDALTVQALALPGGPPVIHDVHDLGSLRRTPYEDGFAEAAETAEPFELERAAVQGCAALVTVSPELLEQVAARHRLPARTLVFENFALARDLPRELPDPERNGPVGMVYQGTLSADAGHYDLRDCFAAIAAHGVALDVFAGRAAPEYEAIAGVRCHPPRPPAALLAQLPAYDLGWAGMNATLNGAHLDTALPNKAYEYLGCGLPVITLRPGHRALCRLLSEHGVGLALDDVAQLPDALAGLDLPALRRRVAAVRDELTFEANIDRLLALYDELTDTDSTGGSRVATSPQVAPASPEPNTSPEVAPK